VVRLQEVVRRAVTSDKGHYYVLADRTCRLTPDGWARRAVAAFDEHQADRLVAESNQGGELVSGVIRTVRPTLPVSLVRATRGKRVRAEPIAALYEQGRVHHLGAFADLEDQMCTFAPDVVTGSPDRVDALVWALTELSEPGQWQGLMEYYRQVAAGCKQRQDGLPHVSS